MGDLYTGPLHVGARFAGNDGAPEGVILLGLGRTEGGETVSVRCEMSREDAGDLLRELAAMIDALARESR